MSSGQGGQGASPMSNLTYDLIASLHSKLEGLAAYDKYLQDAQGDQQGRQLFQELMQDDQRHVERLRQELTRHLSGGQ
jgi:bacterioferritin (cytochrome b1)